MNIFAALRRNTCALFPLLAIHPFMPAASAAAPSPTEATAKMDQMLAAAFRADAPGVAVLVVQNGNAILHQGYGLADLELGVPMAADQVLPLCSITKQFTAVAILQLVETGKLKLDDDLSQFLPDYPTGGAKVTIEQLLMHTAGVPSIEEDPDALKRWREDLSPDQLLDYTRHKPLAFAPGTNWKYSNSGYFLLGRVIEKVSGQSYADYIRKHLLIPAGMTHSDYPDGNRIIAKRAHGFSRMGKTWIDTPYFNITQAYSAGALLASVDDLWAWERALQSGTLVNAGLLQRAYTEGHLPDGRATRYGFGWGITRVGEKSMIGHAGGMPGFSAFEARVPDSGIYVALLCNTDAPPKSLRILATRLVRLALGEPIEGSAAAATSVSSGLDDYTGSYQLAPGASFVVTLKDSSLYGQLGPGRRLMKAAGPDEFTDGNEEMVFHFMRDPNHRVSKILVATDGPGPELIWPRTEPSTSAAH